MEVIYKRRLNYIAIIVILSVFFISCEGPDETVPEISVIDLIHENVEMLNKKIPENDNSFRKWKTWNKLVLVQKNSEITFISKEPDQDSNILIYTTKNNQFKTSKKIYLNYINDKLHFSLDKKDWYSIKNTLTRTKSSISSKKTENNLMINYTLAYSLKENAEKIKLSVEKEEINLTKGMILRSSADKNEKESKIKILILPKNTTISPGINISGNIINFKIENGVIFLNAMKNMYIYAHNEKINISFDRKNWSLSPFSFDIKSDYSIKAIDDNKITFDLSGTVEYEKGSFNLSIFRLLI